MAVNNLLARDDEGDEDLDDDYVGGKLLIFVFWIIIVLFYFSWPYFITWC